MNLLVVLMLVMSLQQLLSLVALSRRSIAMMRKMAKTARMEIADRMIMRMELEESTMPWWWLYPGRECELWWFVEWLACLFKAGSRVELVLGSMNEHKEK